MTKRPIADPVEALIVVESKVTSVNDGRGIVLGSELIEVLEVASNVGDAQDSTAGSFNDVRWQVWITDRGGLKLAAVADTSIANARSS